jgi:trans-2,3-dihydro-3-hydroxyanthranilate isomerase
VRRAVDLGDEHVRRLEVAVDDPLLVRVLHRRADLEEQPHALAHAQAALVGVRGERDAVHALHHEVRFAGLGGARVVDARDVRVLHERQHLPLGLEAREHLGPGDPRAEELEGDLAAHRRVLLGQIHRAHAALAEQADDAVRPDDRAARVVRPTRQRAVDDRRGGRGGGPRALAGGRGRRRGREGGGLAGHGGGPGGGGRATGGTERPGRGRRKSRRRRGAGGRAVPRPGRGAARVTATPSKRQIGRPATRPPRARHAPAAGRAGAPPGRAAGYVVGPDPSAPAAVRHLRYVTADVFTDRQFGGNPLAVVLDAGGLGGDEMLAVTREFNYSETTFVLPPERGGAARVRIFTPAARCRSPGTRRWDGARARRRRRARRAGAPSESDRGARGAVGDVPVRVRLGAGAPSPLGAPEPAYAELTAAEAPSERERPDAALLAAALALEPATCSAATTRRAWRAAGCRSCSCRCATARRGPARVRHDAWERALPPDAWTRELMVFAMDGERADVRARVFVPGLSVPEDPATGSANAALGGYLARRTPRLDAALAWTVEQGVEMGRPSLLRVFADKRGGAVAAIRVGGEA